MKNIKEPHEYWYYFGKCMPYPTQISIGTLPIPPYKKFNTEEECQLFINKQSNETTQRFSVGATEVNL
jgi:hypothetical protein